MIRIDDLDDARLEPYRSLKDRELAREGGLFLAESKRLVLRAIEAGIELRSVLTDERRADEVAAVLGDRAPLYVVTDDAMKHVAGYAIHTGVLAVGRRPDPVPLTSLMGLARDPVTLLVVPQIKDQTNLGSLMRIAAAFGVTALVLGPECCDPFYRRSVRVSMGAVFHLPIHRSADLLADLDLLHDRFGVDRIATVLDTDAEPLHAARRGPRLAVLLGHEVDGLPPDVVARCDRRVTIPVHMGTDSLNVSIAAAVFCYHFTKPA